MRLLLACLAVLSTLLQGVAMAASQQWPSRPVKIVVAYSPGGSGDLVARLLAHKLEELTGGTFYVENRTGASGNIGTAYVAAAEPDGYTLLLGSDITFAINPHFFKRLPYNLNQFAPVSLVASFDLVLAANPSIGVSTVPDLVALAKSDPGKLNYASIGIGSTHHLAMEMLQQMGPFKLTHIPYRGSGQALPALLADQVQLMLLGVPASVPFLRSGKLKALGVASSQRISALPDVPTIAEQGFPGFEANNLWCLYAPAGTSPDIIDKLQRLTAKGVMMPALRARFLAAGLEPIGSTPEFLSSKMNQDSAKWAKIITSLGLVGPSN